MGKLPFFILLGIAAAANPLEGQARLHVTGTAGVTDLRPGPGGSSYRELTVEQVMARVAARTRDGRWRFWGSGNAEGLTMPDAVLNAGAFGEGYADRRHPHTYLHELAVGAVLPVGAGRVSLTAGKGFVAFGTDDPMHRPALKYPVNHHWAQIVERLVVIGGVAAGPVVLEGTLFNGDEPSRPDAWPSLSRFGDSWAVRGTLRPWPGFEAQQSWARVVSPEHRPGAGPVAMKWSAATLLHAPWAGGRVSALGEWARTEEVGRAYASVLAEAEWHAQGHRPYVRVERSDRPEEERQLDPFLTVRPHLDDHLLGITRWTVVTLGYGYQLSLGGVTFEPIVEGALARVRETTGALFDPQLFYGDDALRSVTVALRVHWGTAGTMGRYGVRDDADGGADLHHH